MRRAGSQTRRLQRKTRKVQAGERKRQGKAKGKGEETSMVKGVKRVQGRKQENGNQRRIQEKYQSRSDLGSNGIMNEFI